MLSKWQAHLPSSCSAHYSSILPRVFDQLRVPCFCAGTAQPAQALLGQWLGSTARCSVSLVPFATSSAKGCAVWWPCRGHISQLPCSQVLCLPSAQCLTQPPCPGTAVPELSLVLPCTWPSQKQWFEVFQNSLITWVLLSFYNRRSGVYWITGIRHPVANKTLIFLMTRPTGRKLQLAINMRGKESSCLDNIAGMTAISIYALSLNESRVYF